MRTLLSAALDEDLLVATAVDPMATEEQRPNRASVGQGAASLDLSLVLGTSLGWQGWLVSF